ncbi:MAG: NTP transferase domain-containing protein [Myxococcota bacterium]
MIAGGASRRMGFDKARASVDGWPMAPSVAEALRAVCRRVSLVRRGPPDGYPWRWRDGTAIEVVREADQGSRHPLVGVATALAHASSPWVLVAPCDGLGLEEVGLRALVEAAPSVASEGDRLHPLIGVFPASHAPRAAALAQAGQAARAFVEPFNRVALSAVRNVNRPEDGIDDVHALLEAWGPLAPDAQRRALRAEAYRRLEARGAWIPWAPGEAP